MTDDPTLDDTRMSIGQHLEELRWHVLKAVGYVFIAFLVAFYLQAPLLEIAQWPYQRAAQNVINSREIPGVDEELRDALVEISEGYRELDQELNKAAKDELFLIDALEPGNLTEALTTIKAEQEELKKRVQALQAEQTKLREQEQPVLRSQIEALRTQREALQVEQVALDTMLKEQVGPFKDRMARLPRMELVQIRPQEAFLSALKLSLVVALFFASPFVAREMWGFVSKGLYGHEKKYVNYFAPLTVVAFACGTLFGYFILIPYGVEFLIGYLPDVSGSISFGEYLKLFTLLTVLVGAIFELPLVMVFLTLIGVGNATLYRKYFKFWFMAAFIIGAVLTPPDPVTQVLMAFPLVGLFWVGVFASAMVGKRTREPEDDASPPTDPPAKPAAKLSAPDATPSATEPATPSTPAAEPSAEPPPAAAAPNPAAAVAAAIPVLRPPEGTQPRVESSPEPAEAPEATDGTDTESTDTDDAESVDGEESSSEAASSAEEGEPKPPAKPKPSRSPHTHYALSPEEQAAYEAKKFASEPEGDDADDEDEEETGEGGEPEPEGGEPDEPEGGEGGEPEPKAVEGGEPEGGEPDEPEGGEPEGDDKGGSSA